MNILGAPFQMEVQLQPSKEGSTLLMHRMAPTLDPNRGDVLLTYSKRVP